MKKRGAKSGEEKDPGPRTKLEAVTVRINPQARWTLELMTRALSKPTSTVFEWCVRTAAKLVDVPGTEGEPISIGYLSNQQYDDIYSRVLVLNMHAPSLLNLEEKAVIEIVKISSDLWFTGHQFVEKEGQPYYGDSIFISAHWDAVAKLAEEAYYSVPRKPITRKDVLAISENFRTPFDAIIGRRLEK